MNRRLDEVSAAQDHFKAAVANDAGNLSLSSFARVRIVFVEAHIQSLSRDLSCTPPISAHLLTSHVSQFLQDFLLLRGFLLQHPDLFLLLLHCAIHIWEFLQLAQSSADL